MRMQQEINLKFTEPLNPLLIETSNVSELRPGVAVPHGVVEQKAASHRISTVGRGGPVCDLQLEGRVWAAPAHGIQITAGQLHERNCDPAWPRHRKGWGCLSAAPGCTPG